MTILLEALNKLQGPSPAQRFNSIEIAVASAAIAGSLLEFVLSQAHFPAPVTRQSACNRAAICVEYAHLNVKVRPFRMLKSRLIRLQAIYLVLLLRVTFVAT